MAEGDLGLPPPPKIGVSEKRTEREIDNIHITISPSGFKIPTGLPIGIASYQIICQDL